MSNKKLVRNVKKIVFTTGIILCLSACTKENEPEATKPEATPTEVVSNDIAPTEELNNVTSIPEATESPEKSEDKNIFENSNQLKRPDTLPVFDVTVELGQYKGLEIPFVVKEVTDEDIQKELDLLRNVYPDKKEIGDRELKPGDTVRIDYQGYYNGIQYDDAMAYFAEITIPENQQSDSFYYDLVGHKAGDDLEIKIIYPEDYSGKKSLAGKEIDYKIHIREAYNYVPAEVTEEFINATGYATLEDYKTATRQLLEENETEKAEKKAEDDLMNMIIDNCTYGGQIQQELDYMYEKYLAFNDDYAEEMMYSSGAQYFSMIDEISEEEYYSQARKTSDRNTKFDRVLLEIAKTEGLTCDSEEIVAEGKKNFGDEYSTDPKAKLYKDYTKDEIDRILTETVLKEKAYELVKENTIFIGK